MAGLKLAESRRLKVIGLAAFGVEPDGGCPGQRRVEEFRDTSVIEPHAVATIAGQGIDGYRQALEVLARPGA